jgi:X-Pro dipeptidyl-peptidase (S15 family)
MAIDWDIPVAMDDGVVLRADVFRPGGAPRYPVILSCGPYAKGLAFQDSYPDQWRIMTQEHPDVTAGSTGRYQTGRSRRQAGGARLATFSGEMTGCGPFRHDDRGTGRWRSPAARRPCGPAGPGRPTCCCRSFLAS